MSRLLTIDEAIGILNDAGFDVEKRQTLFFVDTEPEPSLIDQQTLFDWARQIVGIHGRQQ